MICCTLFLIWRVGVSAWNEYWKSSSQLRIGFLFLVKKDFFVGEMLGGSIAAGASPAKAGKSDVEIDVVFRREKLRISHRVKKMRKVPQSGRNLEKLALPFRLW